MPKNKTRFKIKHEIKKQKNYNFYSKSQKKIQLKMKKFLDF
jgi:hypothetical protein